jgi:hypothetical protein
MNLGYACINMTLGSQKPKITTNRSMIKKTFDEKGIDYAGELALQNVRDLFTILQWNNRKGIKLCRMSSDILPWASEYGIENSPYYKRIETVLRACGNYATQNNIRIGCHPGPFNVLVSPNEKVVQNTLLKEDELPVQQIDLEISLSEIFADHENRMKIPRLKRIIDQFEPTGPGNMKPIFMAKNCYATETLILGEKHLKLSITQSDSDVQIPAIGFNLASKEELVAKGLAFDIAFTLESNTWKNKTTLQLNIKDIK